MKVFINFLIRNQFHVMLIGQVKLLERLWFAIHNFVLEPQWG